MIHWFICIYVCIWYIHSYVYNSSTHTLVHTSQQHCPQACFQKRKEHTQSYTHIYLWYIYIVKLMYTHHWRRKFFNLPTFSAAFQIGSKAWLCGQSWSMWRWCRFGVTFWKTQVSYNWRRVPSALSERITLHYRKRRKQVYTLCMMKNMFQLY